MAINNKTYRPLQAVSITAAEDIPAFRFVDHNGNLCAADSKSMGVSEISWLSEENISIITIGTIAVETSGSINAGDAVTSDLGGKAKAVTAAEPVNGRALNSCTGAGFVTIQLIP